MTMDYLLFLCGFLLPLSSAVEGKILIAPLFFMMALRIRSTGNLGGILRVFSICALVAVNNNNINNNNNGVFKGF